MTSVIVFGPTGNIGSVAARTAAQHGAKVWLAMRDTNKAIPGLGKDGEDSGTFRRVQADLQNAESIKNAVQTSGAKRAFLYLAHGSKDHMRSTFEALKSAGIVFVVFLSSFTINTDIGLRDIPASEVIPYVHAQAEANLEEVFAPEQWVALRPGAFATNILRYKQGIAAGHVELFGGEFRQDNITPGDMGRVAGTILVSGPRNGQQRVYLYGPEVQSMHDILIDIGKTLGKDVKVTPQSADDAHKVYTNSGVPEFMAKYMIRILSSGGPDEGSLTRFPSYEEGVNNIKLYTGRQSTSLADWVNENKAEFSA